MAIEIGKLIPGEGFSFDLKPVFATDEERIEYEKRSLRADLEKRIDEIVRRQVALPAAVILGNGEGVDFLRGLWDEARALYCHGYFYGCVCMCGIVSEGIIKDIFLGNLRIGSEIKSKPPEQKALDKFAGINFNVIAKICKEEGFISKEVFANAESLSEIRNRHVHARGEGTQEDAIECLGKLAVVISGTISFAKLFDDFSKMFSERL